MRSSASPAIGDKFGQLISSVWSTFGVNFPTIGNFKVAQPEVVLQHKNCHYVVNVAEWLLAKQQFTQLHFLFVSSGTNWGKKHRKKTKKRILNHADEHWTSSTPKKRNCSQPVASSLVTISVVLNIFFLLSMNTITGNRRES